MTRTWILSLGATLLLPGALAGQPSASKAAERAAALPLFASRAPLQLVLAADFRAISRDRDTLSTKRFPGTLKYAAEGGDTIVVPVELRTRGHFRLLQRNCPFVPLRVDFPRAKGPDAVAKTPFAGQSGLKLVTHCRNEERYEQIVYREELIYRLHNLVSPLSFRSRLASMTYQDTTGKSLGRFPAFFIEHENDVARRNGAKVAELRGALFDDLDPTEATRFALFEYMIGNTDFSIYSLHNVRLMVADGQRYMPAAYDFDFSGLLNAHYATPDPRLGIRDVRTRLFRGGCSQIEHLPQVVSEFLGIKETALALYDSAAYLDRGAVRDAKYYLTEFFKTIEDQRELKTSIADRCVKTPGV
jgi:hypothetical protein